MLPSDRADTKLWLENGRIRAATLHFSSPELEQAFEKHRLLQSHRLDRVWSYCALGFFIGYGLIEALLLETGLMQAYLIRYAIGTPLLLFALIYSDPLQPRPFPIATRIGAIVLAQGLNIVLFALTPYPVSDIYFLFALIAAVFTHGFGWLRFSEAVLIGLFTYLAYLAVIVFQDTPSATVAAIHALILFFLNLTSMFTHYRQEIYMRREFRTRCIMEGQMERQLDLVRSAEEASAAKSRFLAMMSHELRTPLNAIIGFAEIMRSELMGPMQNERYRGYVADVLSSGRHLLRIINDILDLSKAEAGKLELDEDRTVVPDVLKACISLVTFGNLDKGAAIRTAFDEELPDLLVDELKLRQMILNLLSNARKFTSETGEIVVSARHDAGGGIRIEVRDNGIGIAPEDMEIVLQPFGQAERTEVRRYQGTGLGLPLVRQLAELHGADFAIESAPGKGTAVSLTFPAARIVASGGAGQQAPAEH